MKADSAYWRTPLFFGSLAIIALLINSAFMGRDDSLSVNNDLATARMEAATKAAKAEHARYLAQYLNSGVSRKPGFKMVGIAVVSEDGKLNPALNESIIGRFKSDSIEIVPSVFQPQFVSDGLFANALAGSKEIIEKLELSKSFDMLLLGREEVQYSTDPSLQNVISANMRLEITAISVTTGDSRSWTFVASGSGFKESESRQMAEERLINQIARDTKMSLNL